MEKCLTDLPYWNMLTDDQRDSVRQTAVMQHYKKGELVHTCNRQCEWAMYIIRGRIRLYLLSDEGKEVTLCYVEQGEVCVMTPSCVTSQITFEAELAVAEDVEALAVPLGVFEKLMAENIYIRCYMYELTNKRYASTIFVMQQIMFCSMDKRLATYLVFKHDRLQTNELHLTQDGIAKDINSAREVVARMLKTFMLDGLIENRRGVIVLKDVEGLRAMA